MKQETERVRFCMGCGERLQSRRQVWRLAAAAKAGDRPATQDPARAEARWPARLQKKKPS